MSVHVLAVIGVPVLQSVPGLDVSFWTACRSSSGFWGQIRWKGWLPLWWLWACTLWLSLVKNHMQWRHQGLILGAEDPGEGKFYRWYRLSPADTVMGCVKSDDLRTLHFQWKTYWCERLRALVLNGASRRMAQLSGIIFSPARKGRNHTWGCEQDDNQRLICLITGSWGEKGEETVLIKAGQLA